MRRDIRWRGLESGSTEVCRIDACAGGVTIRGEVAGSRRIDYEIRLDAAWRFSTLHLTTDGETALGLGRDAGIWTLDGVPRPDLSDARDIDLSFSPSTNTLPIRRLALEVADSADIVTAYVAPDLSVQPDPQRYTRLDARTYLYESRDSGFTRRITVDEDGVVVDYPGLFRRLID